MTFRQSFPNFLSFSRIFLALGALWLPKETFFYLLILAALSDFFDGFLARKWHVESRLGVLIDPVGDKLIAVVFSYLFWMENLLSSFQLFALFSRDIALLSFCLVLFMKGWLRYWKVQSFWIGKIMTFFQFAVFLLSSLSILLPNWFYTVLLFLGLASVIELGIRFHLSRKR